MLEPEIQLNTYKKTKQNKKQGHNDFAVHNDSSLLV